MSDDVARPWDDPGLNELMMFTLYERPLDFPDAFVIRAWVVQQGNAEPKPTARAVLFASERSARRWMQRWYPDKVWMPRHDEDEPQILGNWI